MGNVSRVPACAPRARASQAPAVRQFCHFRASVYVVSWWSYFTCTGKTSMNMLVQQESVTVQGAGKCPVPFSWLCV